MKSESGAGVTIGGTIYVYDPPKEDSVSVSHACDVCGAAIAPEDACFRGYLDIDRYACLQCVHEYGRDVL